MNTEEKREVVTVKADNGDIYEAVRTGNSYWSISFPEGADRFYGTESEVKAHIKRLMSGKY